MDQQFSMKCQLLLGRVLQITKELRRQKISAHHMVLMSRSIHRLTNSSLQQLGSEYSSAIWNQIWERKILYQMIEKVIMSWIKHIRKEIFSHNLKQHNLKLHNLKLHNLKQQKLPIQSLATTLSLMKVSMTASITKHWTGNF